MTREELIEKGLIDALELSVDGLSVGVLPRVTGFFYSNMDENQEDREKNTLPLIEVVCKPLLLRHHAGTVYDGAVNLMITTNVKKDPFCKDLKEIFALVIAVIDGDAWAVTGYNKSVKRSGSDCGIDSDELVNMISFELTVIITGTPEA